MMPGYPEENALKRKLYQKTELEVREEYNRQAQVLREREDYRKELEYFLEIVCLGAFPVKLKQRFKKPLAGFYCTQAPLELFDALGFHPIRLCGGSLAAQRISAQFLPATACPLIKSCVGASYLEDSLEKLCEIIIMPTTCDWNVKLPGMRKDEGRPSHIMELPHIKDSERGQRRWLEEIIKLKRFLERRSRRRLDRKELALSVNKYMDAWKAFGQMIELRRKKIISGTWAIVLANALLIDDVESWTGKVKAAIESYDKAREDEQPAVFLAGSPISFPCLKIPELVEEAGMFILADELCTSERIAGSVICDDYSEFGLLEALGARYHLSCSCPTYADNDRRVKNVLHCMRTYNIKGVIYHQLKGCHPYDIESFAFEQAIKESGFHFLKVETDYSKEDRQNILTKLEAFRETLS